MISIISCNHFPDDERIFHRQIQSLIENKLKVVYFTRSNSLLNLSNNFITHYNFNANTNIKSYINAVYKILSSLDPLSYLQIHETELLPLLRIMKKKNKKLVTIYDVHENMESLYQTFSARIKPIKEMLIYFRNLREQSHLKYVDTITLANVPLGINPYYKYEGDVIVIENFPTDKLLNLKQSSKNKLSKILYHGHLGPERGIDDLVKAMKKVVVNIKNVDLTLIGTFRTLEYEKYILSLINKLELSKKITIIGQIPHNQIWDHLGKHGVGVIPFKNTPLTRENTPTKLFEMMLSGLEIVSSDLPPIRNYVENSVHWFIPEDIPSLSDAIVKACLCQENSLKTKTNRDLIKNKYNWDIIKNKYVSLFN